MWIKRQIKAVLFPRTFIILFMPFFNDIMSDFSKNVQDVNSYSYGNCVYRHYILYNTLYEYILFRN